MYFRLGFKTLKESNPNKNWIVCLSNLLNIDLDLILVVRSSISGSRKSSGDGTDHGDLASPHIQNIGGVLIQDNVESWEEVIVN